VASVAYEARNLNDIGAILENSVTMKAFRHGALPFPDDTIIATRAWKDMPPDENSAVFGRFQSFVPRPATKLSDAKVWARSAVFAGPGG
jgi:hypothetical protein